MTDVPVNAASQSTTVEPSLHRVMGPWLLLLFIVGDILGTGIYALTGQVAKQVGGVVWLPFLVAFVVALITAFSYLELVTKYPKAAGAALYTHKAFGIHFITFIVAFAVMCSGITSASTASRAFAANMSSAMGLGLTGWGITVTGLAFMAIVAAVNFRGVGESVKANVVLTCVELTGLLIVIVIGLWAIGMGQGDVSRVMQFKSTPDGGMFWPVIAATTLAFFAMVGFEDWSTWPRNARIRPVTSRRCCWRASRLPAPSMCWSRFRRSRWWRRRNWARARRRFCKWFKQGAPNFPLWIFGFITMFAVANSALINMLMASRLVYGMSREHVLPPALGKVHTTRRTPYVAIGFTTLLAFALITFVGEVPALGGTTALLLLCVFTVVNVAVLVLRQGSGRAPAFPHADFSADPGRGVLRVSDRPWTGRAVVQYHVAGVLLAIGVGLWFVTVMFNRATGVKQRSRMWKPSVAAGRSTNSAAGADSPQSLAPWMASMTAAVTSAVRALPPRSGV